MYAYRISFLMADFVVVPPLSRTLDAVREHISAALETLAVLEAVVGSPTFDL